MIIILTGSQRSNHINVKLKIRVQCKIRETQNVKYMKRKICIKYKVRKSSKLRA